MAQVKLTDDEIQAKLGIKRNSNSTVKSLTPIRGYKSSQSDTPSVQKQTGSLPNALQRAELTLARANAPKLGVGFNNKPTVIPVKKAPTAFLPTNNARAYSQAQKIGEQAQGMTAEDLRRQNLAKIIPLNKSAKVDGAVGANAMAGIGQFNSALAKTADFILPDVITPKAVQKTLDYYKNTSEQLSQHATNVNEEKGVPQWAGQLIQGTVAAVPNAALAMMSGGASLGTQALGQASTGLAGTVTIAMQTIAKTPTFYTSLAQTMGPAYEEAKANGASELEAQAVGIIGGFVNAGIEIGGGIETVAANPRSLLNWVRSMIDEGKEEVLQGIVENLMQKATYDKNKKWVSATDENAVINPSRMAQEFAGGAVVGGVLGGGQMLAGKALGMSTEQDGYLPERGENATAAELAGALEINDPFAREETKIPAAEVQKKVEETNREFGLIDSVTMWSDDNYRSDPDRERAKNGDEQAAKRLVDKLVTPEFAEKVKQKYPDAVIVPVVDFERTANSNVLPAVFASKLSDMTGLTATLKICKMNTTDRAHAKNALERLMQRAEFSGEVIPGKQYYLMADDFVSTGFTLADLKRYIESKGGKVVGAVTLAATNEESLRLDPTAEELERLNGYDRTVLEDILRSYQITDNIENLSRAEIQKIAAVLGKGEKGGYKGEELYNRLRTALDASQRSGNERIVSKRQNNLLNETTAQNGGFSMPENRQLPPGPALQQPQQLAPGLNASFSANTVGAAESNPRSYAHLQNQYGTVEPGENPARVVDVPKKDAEGNVVSLFARTGMESQHMPDELIEPFEQAVASGQFSHAVFSDRRAKRYAEHHVAQGFDHAWSLWRAVADGTKVATKDDIALGELLLANAMKDKRVDLAIQLTAELCAEATRAGQNVQAFRLLKKMTPEGQLFYLQKVTDKLNKQYEGRKGFDRIKLSEGRVKELSEATTKEAMDKAVDKIKQDIADQTPVTFEDRWNAWRYLAMLGNVRTQVRNIFGNALFLPAVKTKNLIATGIERAAGKRLPERTKALLNPKKDKALIDYGKNDFENVKHEVSGGDKYTEQQDILSKRRIFRLETIERARVITHEIMEWGDRIFSKSHYATSLAAYMKSNNLTPDAITPEQLNKARNYAIKEAQKATFRDSNAFASFLNATKKNLAARSRNADSMWAKAGWKAAEAIAEGIVPFTKTPANIMARGVEYSPLGLAYHLLAAKSNIKSGKMTAAEVIDGIAAGLTGTALAGLGALLASMGAVTGVAGDEKEDKYKKMLGEQEYSLKIGEDSYTIDWLAPAALPFFTGVALYDAFVEPDKISFPQLLDALSTIGEPMFELSMLQGINDALGASKYSDQAPVVSILSNAAFGYAGQVVPTSFGQVARAVDKTRRQTYYNPNYKGAIKEGLAVGQKQVAKIPFASKALQPSIDMWGRERENEGGSFVGRLAYNMLSPGYASTNKATHVDKELLKLHEATGENSVLPSYADKSFKLPADNGGDSVKLTAKEYTEYAKAKGSKAYDIFDSVIGTKNWNSLSDEDKVAAAGKVYEYANALAKSEVSDYTLRDTAAKFQRCEKAGIPAGVAIVAYVAQKDIKGDKDSKGNTIQLSASKKKKEAIDRMTPFITKKQRELLYELFEVSEKVW